MSLTVIPGGLFKPDTQLLEDDIPCPDKPAEEWTAEEEITYRRYLWEDAEPGSIESVVKSVTITSEDLTAAMRVLEKIKSAAAEAAANTGFRNEWDYSTPEDLLMLLQFKNDTVS